MLIIPLLSTCSPAAPQGALTASGFIEGEEVIIAAETAGRVAEVLVERGGSVQAGQVLVRLDDALLQSQRQEAAAALAAAQANLAQVEAGVRPAEIAAAQAVLARAEAEQVGAERAVLAARDAISNPLSLDAEIDAARTQVQLAEQHAELARAQLAETELKYGVYVVKGASDDTVRAWTLQLQAAQAGLALAQADLKGQRAYLDALLGMRARPLELEAHLHQAEAQQSIAEAGVAAAQAALAALEAGPTAEQVAIAEAMVRQARAAVGLVDARIAQLTLAAPLDGIVTSRSVQSGEMALAGTPLLTIANLGKVTLVIYIPEDQIGRVRLGQAVEVSVDAFPGRVFTGQVTHIAGEAEFTPRNVQTQEERVNLVFAVKVTIPNAEGGLKPGMPADAMLK